MRVGQAILNEELKPVLEFRDSWFDLNKLLVTDPNFIDTGSEVPLHLLRPFLEDYDYLLQLIDHLSDAARDGVTIAEPVNFGLPCEPRQVVCVGRNYAAHAAELGNDVPESPMLFNKLPGTCIADGAAIEFSETLGRVDYEGEIGVVLGADLWQARPEEVFEAIWGYTLLNDVTARDLQKEAKGNGHPWLLAKNHATFCPIGPTVTLRDTLSWPLAQDITTVINGETRQSGNTRDFIFDLPTLLSYISARIPLFSGDIVATGTPEGVGPLNQGDTVEISSPGMGKLGSIVSISSLTSS